MAEDKPKYYVIIPAEVRYDDRLTSTAKLLYGEILTLSRKEGMCWSSNKYFADLYGLTTQAISAAINLLWKYHYIEIEYERNESYSTHKGRQIKLPEGVSNIFDGYQINFKGVSNKLDGGYQINFKHNNTSINNTSIINASSEIETEEEEKKIVEALWGKTPEELELEEKINAKLKEEGKL